METIAALLSILQKPLVWKILLGAGILWLAVAFFCWISGTLGFFSEGTRRRLHSRLPGCLPLGQVYYTLRLAGKKRSAAWAVFLIWWALAFMILGATGVIWGLVFSTQNVASPLVLGFLSAGGIFLGLAALCYLLLRILEFRGLARLLNWKQWLISLLCSLLALPAQRIFLYTNFKEQAKEKSTV